MASLRGRVAEVAQPRNFATLVRGSKKIGQLVKKLVRGSNKIWVPISTYYEFACLFSIRLTPNHQAGAGGGGPPAEPTTPRDFAESGQEAQFEPTGSEQPQPDAAPGEQQPQRRGGGNAGQQPMPRAEVDVSRQALVGKPLKVSSPT